MPKLNLTERELAEMWSVSPKTLQRWRTEGRGPRYLKLSKRVAYPIEEIRKFESKVLYTSTSERASDIALWHDSKPMTANDTAAATDLPIHELSFSSEDAHEVVRPVGQPSEVSSSAKSLRSWNTLNWCSTPSAWKRR